jgi:hypothetical protein
VKDKINKLRRAAAAGPDGIGPGLLAPVLALIFNKSFNTGEHWKEANMSLQSSKRKTRDVPDIVFAGYPVVRISSLSKSRIPDIRKGRKPESPDTGYRYTARYLVDGKISNKCINKLLKKSFAHNKQTMI